MRSTTQVPLTSVSMYKSELKEGKRRIHKDGIKMLESHNDLQEEKMRMQVMENRIRRLEYED